MDSEYVTRQEHIEFARRMDDANKNQLHRIKLLEESTKQITSIALSVERLATNMESMAKEQKSQGEKLESLEARDGEMWRKVVGYVLTAVAGAIIGFMFKQIGM